MDGTVKEYYSFGRKSKSIESLVNNALKRLVFNTNFAFSSRGRESLNDRRGRAAGETNSRPAWTMHPGVHRVYPILC